MNSRKLTDTQELLKALGLSETELPKVLESREEVDAHPDVLMMSSTWLDKDAVQATKDAGLQISAMMIKERCKVILRENFRDQVASLMDFTQSLMEDGPDTSRIMLEHFQTDEGRKDFEAFAQLAAMGSIVALTSACKQALLNHDQAVKDAEEYFKQQQDQSEPPLN